MTAPTRKRADSEVDRRRRRHPRYQADFQVVASHLEGNQYKKLQGHCRDMSEAGLGMLLPAEISIGEVVGLSFSLPELAASLELRGVVRYRRGYHYGFEFLSLSKEQRKLLESYLAGRQVMD
jgi:hypothetical protein